MNPLTETIALMAGGCVIRYGPHGWNVGGQPISDEVVYALLRRAWIEKRDSHASFVLTAKGKKALDLAQKVSA